ncbi:PREDICTED: cellular nucleic acid-binding protein-like [Acromyrmex echinatior]|uniref:cellular nucleic acid-binding protein-like n=1 Tax=Acromyrmex echinatior TaxID=103372 RepID=UPI000580C6AD|nr:PREDICTED: cellular nucleic acid-binding protein-like [Acromyrmex echinatior]
MRTRERNNMQKKIEEARKPSTSKGEKEQETDVRYYNCGDKGHKAKDCKKKELSKKCFKCQKYGHTARLCNASDDSEAVTDKKTTVINTVTDTPSDRMCKRITINDVRVNALIDTGSQITIMRKDVTIE